jgi:hypothetical protein
VAILFRAHQCRSVVFEPVKQPVIAVEHVGIQPVIVSVIIVESIVVSLC